MKALILASILAGCLLSPQSVSAFSGDSSGSLNGKLANHGWPPDTILGPGRPIIRRLKDEKKLETAYGYGNNYYGSGNNLGYSYSNLGSVGGCNYGGVTSSPYTAGYGSGTATTTYMPAAGMSETQFSGGGSATTTYMPYAGMSSTTYRSGY